MKTPTLLRYSISAMVVLLVVLIGPIIWLDFQVAELVSTMAGPARERTVAGCELEINLLDYGLAVRRYQTTLGKADLDQAHEGAEKVTQALRDYRSFAKTPEQDELTRGFDVHWLAVLRHGGAVLAAPRSESAGASLAQLHQAVDAAERFLDEKLQPDAAKSFAAMRTEVLADIDYAIWLAIVALITGIGVTLGLGRWAGRRIVGAEAALRELNVSLELRVRERTGELQRSVRELERSNQTLQEFAAIAAHDLQTPLRAIHGFSGVLRAAHQSGQYQDTAGPLNHIMEAAGRMQAMTNDLLLYAQASDPAAPLQEVSLEQAFEEAAGMLRPALATLGGSLSHGPLPRLPAVRTEMVLLLRNLIGNAIKFHGTAAPRVHVSAQQQDGAWRVTVEDNGIGIDPRYHERIFEVFRRLHGPQRYPGTGMGLALVKRLVEQRGGRVGVDSTPGHGSRFWFTMVDGDGQ